MLTATAIKCPQIINFSGLQAEVQTLKSQGASCQLGNQSVLMLVSAGGTQNTDFAKLAPLKTTEALQTSPILSQNLQQFAGLSRVCLCQLSAQTSLQNQADQGYQGWRYLTIYLPLDQPLSIADINYPLTVGQYHHCDHYQGQQLENPHDQAAWCLRIEIERQSAQISLIDTDPSQLKLAAYRFDILRPDELQHLLAPLLLSDRDHTILNQFIKNWQHTYQHHGETLDAELAYQDHLLFFQKKVEPHYRQAEYKHIINIINTQLHTSHSGAPRFNRQLIHKRQQQQKLVKAEPDFICPQFDRPIFIVSAPRAGSTLLFNTLSNFQDLWTIGEESHTTIEGIANLHPQANDFESNRLDANDVVPAEIDQLKRRFTAQLWNRQGEHYLGIEKIHRPAQLRFLEKTPKNALRIPFLKAAFPDALFIYLYREPAGNISSLVEGWRSRRFIAYQDMPGWIYQAWNFLLIPGWKALSDHRIIALAAKQWQVANQMILQDIKQLPKQDWYFLDYQDLIKHPKNSVQKLSQFAGLTWDEQINAHVSKSLPVTQVTLSKPTANKWKKQAVWLKPLLVECESVQTQVEDLKRLA